MSMVCKVSKIKVQLNEVIVSQKKNGLKRVSQFQSHFLHKPM